MISAVVQGPVVGSGERDKNKRFTQRSLESVRKILPEAQLILSTWKGADVRGLDYDVLLLNDEPERIDFAWPNGILHQMTVNLQIISTRNGLEKADRQYAIKMRADTVLEGAGFIEYFKKYNKNKDSDILKNKVVVLPTYNPRKKTKLLFDVCDWFFFGLTDDVKDIFSIPLMDKNKLNGQKINGYHLMSDNYCAEQYIWTSFLKKYKNFYFPYYDYFTPETFALSEKSYVNHTIMVPANRAQIKCLKMPGAGYGARPFLSQGLYSFNGYKNLYNTYNAKKIFYFPNPVEDALYFVLFNLRMIVKNFSPWLYRGVVNFIRKLHGSGNLLK